MWFSLGRVAGGAEVADGAETEALQWFGADDALAARAAGEIELAPPQYVTLLDLREFATVADAMTAIDAAESVDYLPRFHFVDDDAMCIYPEDVAYTDIGRRGAPGPRTRPDLRSRGWVSMRTG